MFISPMLLHRVDSPFDDNDWLSELKLDGIRFLYSTMNGFNFWFRKSEFGWLLQFPDGKPAGVMELVPAEARKAVYGVAKMVGCKEVSDFVILSEPLRCKVKYRELTKAGYLRLPSFVEFAG